LTRATGTRVPAPSGTARLRRDQARAAPPPVPRGEGRRTRWGRWAARARAGVRLLGRALRHPRYALSVLASLAARPQLLVTALRRGWRHALASEVRRLCPGAADLFTPYEAGFFAQVFLFDEYEVGRLPLPAAPVVVDVGANVGFFSWRVHALRPEARILAFEPAADNWRRLERLFALLGVHGEACRQACGAEPGSAALFLRTSVTHSLLPGWHAELDFGAGTERVEVVTLDAACDGRGIARVDLLKVDVEGAEVQVLEGARAVLGCTRHVVLEYHSAAARDACHRTLRAAGFRCRVKRFWGVRAGETTAEEEGLLLCTRPATAPTSAGTTAAPDAAPGRP
jgi:FkbM family methyltransferase